MSKLEEVMKFNDEQLSAIISAHEAGEMARMGSCINLKGKCCIFEAAYQSTNFWNIINWSIIHEDRVIRRKVLDKVGDHIEWFDANYNPRWSSKFFIKKLAERGLI